MNELDERKLAFLLIILILFIAFRIIRAIFRFIKWVLQSIWGLLTGKRYRGNPLESDDWLVRAQARQEIRMNNSLPPLHSQAKPQRKKLFSKKDKPWQYATGWVFNEETQLWEPPKKGWKNKKPKGYKNYQNDTWYPDGNYWDDKNHKWERPDFKK